jgi:hypothetical protein
MALDTLQTLNIRAMLALDILYLPNKIIFAGSKLSRSLRKKYERIWTWCQTLTRALVEIPPLSLQRPSGLGRPFKS